MQNDNHSDIVRTEVEDSVRTVLRIKRKLEEEPLDVLLVAPQEKLQNKRPRLVIERAKVFKFVSSESNSQLNHFHQKMDERTSVKPKREKSMTEQKEVLSSKKLKAAQEARFKVASERRMISMKDQKFSLLDISKDESCSLSGLISDLAVKESSYVYDIYIQDESVLISDALEQKAGTLHMEQEQIYIDDDSGDSDNSSSDSNAEDYYRNDYPEDEWEKGSFDSSSQASLSDLEY